MCSVLTKGWSCGGLKTIKQWWATDRWIVWCKSTCLCLCCVYVCHQWIQPDVLVSAVRWQREDVWGNKKAQKTDAYVASLMHTYTPPCPKAKWRYTTPIIQRSAERHISSVCCGGISCIWGPHTGQEGCGSVLLCSNSPHSASRKSQRIDLWHWRKTLRIKWG